MAASSPANLYSLPGTAFIGAFDGEVYEEQRQNTPDEGGREGGHLERQPHPGVTVIPRYRAGEQGGSLRSR